MITGIVIGFIGGIGSMGCVAGIGMRSLSKHPEILTKYMARKMVRGIKKMHADDAVKM
jgi:hypothetical protein